MRFAGLVVAGAFLWPGAAPAQASQVRIANGTVSFAAAPGEANAVTVVPVDDGVRLRDAGALLAAVPPCQTLDTHEAVCRWGRVSGDTPFVAELGDGDDSVTIGRSPVEPAPGVTGDRILDGPAVLHGGSGNDAIVGNLEVDEIDGGLGSDRIDGGRDGPDVLHYNDRTRSLYIDLFHEVGGEPGEMDQIANIEIVEGGRGGDTMIATPRPCQRNFVDRHLDGGPGDDHLIGSRCSDWLIGQRGNDVIEGRGGNDLLRGDSAVIRGTGTFVDCRTRRRGRDDNDRVNGGPGDDLLCESSGHNDLHGGSGADWLKGGRNRDTFSAGTGSDRVDSRDRFSEIVNCGRGRDRSTLDKRDRPRGCERRTARMALQVGGKGRAAWAAQTWLQPAPGMLTQSLATGMTLRR